MDDHCIFEIDNFLSKEKCDEIIKRFEDDRRKRECRIGLRGGRSHVDKKRKNGVEIVITLDNEKWCDIFTLVNNTFLENVSDEIMRCFCKHFEKYGEDPNVIRKIWFGDKTKFELDRFLQISRTTPNTEFSWHCDCPDPCVFMTGLLYLNSIKSENGGATEFLTGKKVQPEAGKLLLFPAVWSNPHRGMFVSESKYCIAFGVCLF